VGWLASFVTFLLSSRRIYASQKAVRLEPDLVIGIFGDNRNYVLEDKKRLYETFGSKEYLLLTPPPKKQLPVIMMAKNTHCKKASQGK
jgi:Uma2 family endonuclease